MERLWQDLRFGARMLIRQPGFTVVAALTLSLGVGANTAIFSVVNGVLLKPLPYEKPDRLAMLWERRPPAAASRGFEQEMVSPPNFNDWQAQQQSFSHLAYWSGDSEFNLVNDDGSEKIRCSYAASSLFATLGAQPFKGRLLSSEEDRKEGNRAAVISYDFWQRRFGGNERALGQTLTLDTYGRRVYTIVGVAPPGSQFPGKTEVWLPAGWNGLPQDRRGGHWLTVLARLKDGVTLAQAQTEMNLIQSRIEQKFPQHNVGSQVVVTPLLEQTVGRNLQTALWVLWGVIGFVLLIVCANVANLTLARVMKSLLFEVSATDPLTFGLVAALLMGVALLACWIPARRAAQVDPMVVLRAE